MQTVSSSLCGAGGGFWFLSLLLLCDLYAAILKNYSLYWSCWGGEPLPMREVSYLGVNGLSSVTLGYMRNLSWQCSTRHQRMQLHVSLLLSGGVMLLRDFSVYMTFA